MWEALHKRNPRIVRNEMPLRYRLKPGKPSVPWLAEAPHSLTHSEMTASCNPKDF